MAGIYFKETQKAQLGWKWILFIGLYILMICALIDQFKIEKIDVAAVSSIVFSLCLIILFNIIIIIMKLEIEIDNAKISYRYKPFHVKLRVLYWDEVSEFYIREYKPIKEYGGHGLQRKLRYGRAFTVSGRKGLQLILHNGKKVLIGTQKPMELQNVVDKLKSK